MVNRSDLIMRMELADRIAALAESNLRIAQISQDDSMIMYHQGYLSALQDIARSVGMGSPIRADHLPVTIKRSK